ncbi:uncharacterized protein BJ212DRAFT_1576554 [Suillus subaureus]|uniref:Uncharacterized protein n=1 Tax=Suillus subaureus TaxID=48587 RepID=A0A9P7ECY9_9AGAM|nr:uncharacterized protein BJ212DRAFT_1576554 [Suillus subaureus]KAG1818112.1 hypothetical protein BJ212DRAFT_1576554 [Suillus subaureus]
MVGLTRNVPNKPASVPFRPPGAIKPRSAAGTKRKPEAIPSMSGAKQVQPAGGGKGDGSGPVTFLDPFEPPRVFEPEMSIAESEALTRQMQQRQWYHTEEQAEDDNDEGLNDDPDGYIDPVLCTERHQPVFNRQRSPTPVEDEEYSSLPPSSPLAAPWHITKACAPVPLNLATGRLWEVFENTKDIVKKGGKGADMVVAKKIKQWQTAHKGRKNTERLAVDVRKETGTDGPEWDWFFQVCYQSTDESDSGGGNSSRPTIEFESNTEIAPQMTGKKSSRGKNADAFWAS